MQQYRVNYSMLIGLLIGTVVCSGAVYGLWRFQINRKSGWLISEADKALKAGEIRDAKDYYEQYLSIRPKDHGVRVKYANAYADVSQLEDVSGEELGNSLKVLEATVRDSDIVELPEAKNLRGRLVDLYGRETIRRWQDALDHLDMMLQADPNNAELQAKRAVFLVRSGSFDEAIKYSYQLIGYDPKTDAFDGKKATAPHDPQVYSNLASMLRGKEGKPELAERVLDQMIEANPDSAAAYMDRGRLRMAWGEADGGKADGEKAFQLQPDDSDALLFMADLASRDKDYDTARQYIEKGKKSHSKEVHFYKAAAALAMQQKNYEKAIAEIESGMKAMEGQKALDLLIFKAELQIPANDVKGARQTIEDLNKVRNLRPEVIEYYEARILLAEGKWFEAMEAFNRLRSRVEDFGRARVAEVEFNLGLCYERLNRLELAREQYQLVVQQDPQNAPASAGLERVNRQMGVEATDGGSDPFQERVTQELQKPKSEQNWSAISDMLQEFAKKLEWSEADIKIRQAQLLTLREEYDEASKMLAEANRLSPKNLLIHRLAVQLARVNPKVGPAKALTTWQKVVDQFGDQPSLRLDKADILMALHRGLDKRDLLKPELASLLAGIDDWTTAQKNELWSGMAGRYLNLGMPDEARQYLRLAADNQPSELPLRLALFSLALDANDDEGMAEAQKMILAIVGDENDSSWLYAEARRKLSLVRRQKIGPDALDEIRSLVRRALEHRPGWYELHALNAEVELISGNTALALQHYDRAQALGRPTPLAVAQHIRLLAQIGRYNDAGKLLGRIPDTSRQAMLGPLYPEILFRTNQVEEALKQAQAATESDPNNAQNHYWHSQLLARSVQDGNINASRRNEVMAQAIAAMRRATELQPEFPEAWFALINYHAMLNEDDLAQKTLRDAQLVLSGDNLQMFLARSYEALRRWFDAETMYRSVYETAPDQLPRAQQLAAYYLGPVYQQPDRKLKATPLINQILRAGADGKVPPSDTNLLWARRMAAKLLALTGEYPNIVKAEKLLASNSQDGTLPIEDKLAMAEILASRPEPVSRSKAISLLEEVRDLQPLSEQAEIVLGELYYSFGSEWRKYADQMDKAIARFPNSVSARDTYVRKLLNRTDQRSLDLATDHVNKLRQLAPNSMSTFDLSVRLADKIGKEKEVHADLLRRVPKLDKIKELSDEQLGMLEIFANLFVELDDLDTAEQIYRGLAERDPARAYALAQFLGKHRSVEQCFEKLNEVYAPDRLPDMLPVAMAVVREQRDKVGDKFDPEVQRWLNAGLRENPDSIPLLIVQADLFDLQKKYDEASEVYRKLLTRDDLTGIRRAIVLNNLSYLIALAGPAAGSDDDALNLVQEAAQILGPNSDILDTRAVVFMARKQYKQAIGDLALSVTDNPTASKYFHKAQAHLAANENRAAVEAWQKAEALGLNRDALNRMEHDSYDQIKSKIDQLRGGSVSQNEPRKAG